ncbi:MAG: hypothetical protein OXM59_02365 [Gammaproteobacteria bacterium]|nr:hypothetical protein [Gammaproteobacteria bacterium]
MDKVVQGLGWFVRRTASPIELGRFYEEALGLPRLRSWETDEHAGAMYWAGEVCVFETNLIGENAATGTRESQCIPVFRSHDLEASVERLLGSGAGFLRSERDERADTVFVQDPEGFPLGIERVTDDSFFAIDRKLTEAWPLGRTSLPGGIGIDGAVQALGRVVHLTTAPAGDAKFLADTLKLDKLGKLAGREWLGLGDTAVLDIRKSDLGLARPQDRVSVRDTWILREYGHDQLMESMRRKGEQPVSSLKFKGGMLDYFVTPGNRLFGFQQRLRFDPDEPARQMVEDLAAFSRWELETKTQEKCNDQ